VLGQDMMHVGAPEVDGWKRRPEQISVSHPDHTRHIDVSWNDGKLPRALSLHYLRDVPRQ